MRFLYLPTSTELKWGAFKPTFWKKNQKFGRSLLLGFLLLTFGFILTGCQGFMDDYNCNPVGGMPLNSNQ